MKSPSDERGWNNVPLDARIYPQLTVSGHRRLVKWREIYWRRREVQCR
jgi:hypothetical protein